MEKYNNTKIVNDYINGKPIKESMLKKLENNKQFMLQVFLASNDYKMYRFCSKRLKTDYDFIKTLITRFKNNIPFICEVADYYIENSQDELTTNELIILMCNYTQDHPINIYYQLKRESFYDLKRAEFEKARIKNQNNELFEGTGKGFGFIYDKFSGSNIILKNFAEKMVDEILEESEEDIEDLLHRTYRNPEQINSTEMLRFMLRHIKCFDSMLATYLSHHQYLLERFISKLERMIKKWDRYEYEVLRKKCEDLLEQVHDYYSCFEDSDENLFEKPLLSEIEIVLYIAKKYRMEELIALCLGIGQADFESIIECQKDVLCKDYMGTYIPAINVYRKVYHLMESLLPISTVQKRGRKKK